MSAELQNIRDLVNLLLDTGPSLLPCATCGVVQRKGDHDDHDDYDDHDDHDDHDPCATCGVVQRKGRTLNLDQNFN